MHQSYKSFIKGVAPMTKPGRRKYGNRPQTLDGVKYDSAKEARRSQELALLQRAGKISDLEHHKVFDLVVNGMLVCQYEADFTYVEAGAVVVEDVKSSATRVDKVYRLKNKLMKAVHGIEIREV